MRVDDPNPLNFFQEIMKLYLEAHTYELRNNTFCNNLLDFISSLAIIRT